MSRRSLAPRVLAVIALTAVPMVVSAVPVHVVLASGSIQAAIDASAAGDVLLVGPGTFTECLVVTKPLSIHGVGSTTLQCLDANQATISVTNTNLKLTGVSIRNSGGRGLNAFSSDVQIADSNFSFLGATFLDGGAITATASGLTIADTVFTSNNAINGAAIAAYSTDLSIVGGEFTNNTGFGAGGAIYFEDGYVSVLGTSFSRNTASGNGGAIDGADGGGTAYLYLSDVEFDTNSAANGGAAYLTSGAGWIETSRTVFTDNTAVTDGGALVASEIYTRWSEFTSNTAGYGGAIYTDRISSVADTFDANEASDGGALYATQNVSLSGSDFTANSATGYGGAVYTPAYFAANNAFFTDNSAQNGGAIYTHYAPELGFTFRAELSEFTENTAISSGGALFIDGGESTDNYLLSGLFEKNAAKYGGALYGSTSAGASITGRWYNNTATSDGGAINIHGGSVNIAYGDLRTNSAQNGGAVYIDSGKFLSSWTWFEGNSAAYGGAVYDLQSQIGAGSHPVFIRNTATSSGGAWYSSNNTAFKLTGGLFCANSATADGGALAIVEPQGNGRQINNTAFTSNVAGARGGAVAELGGVGRTTWGNNAFAGNDASSGGGFAMFASDITSDLYDNAFHRNGDASNAAVASQVPYAHSFYGNMFFGNVPTVSDNTPATGGTSGNITTIDFFAGTTNFVDNSNCFDDKLRLPNKTLYPGYNGKYVGIEGTFYGADNAVDNDADGQQVFQGDCDDRLASTKRGNAEVPGDAADDDCIGGASYDADADGFYAENDCNDNDASINPFATEIDGNSVDENCDSYISDNDRDGWSAGDGDCDDQNPAANPYGIEVPYDGIAQSCGTSPDADLDGDGYVRVTEGGTDCVDSNASVYPGAADNWYDGIDGNCDGLSDYDQDQDGDDSSLYGGSDCNEFDAAINGKAAEIWYDGVDQNCDGKSDNDQDEDGYDDLAHGGTDCVDTNATVHPDAPELFDGLDNNCDGIIDPDSDGDGILDYYENLAGTKVDDTDSDDDGLSDGQEWGTAFETPLNSDSDGQINALDTDSDGDGISDTNETLPDDDADGFREFLDTDADTTPDAYDNDDDGDTLLTVDEGTEDLDSDGIPNYLDTDSDGDGVADGSELGDEDGDGIPDYLDNGKTVDGDPTAPEGPEGYGFGACNVQGGGQSIGGLWVLGLALVGFRRRR